MRMSPASLAILLSLPVLVAPMPSFAMTAAELYQPLDTSRLTYTEARALQAALALFGTYNGLIDGSFGAGSQHAIDAYARQTGWPTPATNETAALAVFTSQALFNIAGWDSAYIDSMDTSLILPWGHMTKTSDGDYMDVWKDDNSSIYVGVGSGSLDNMLYAHSVTLGHGLAGREPYTLRRADTWITSVSTPGGSEYFRSDRLADGSWTAVLVQGDNKDAGLFAIVTGGIRRGDAGSIVLPQNGYLDQAVRVMRDIASESAKDSPPAAQVAQPPVSVPEAKGSFSGTGFLVSGDGKMLTNNHVIEHCSDIKIGSDEAKVLAADPTFDLALLDVPGLADKSFASFTSAPAMLNSDLTVAGFPLHGILSGLNVTRGSLTSLKGLGGSSAQMQISAPVQPGNSGGPVLNAAGGVIGVVVSKLDAGLVQDAIGDVPQNVNFAIRGEVAKLFLSSNGVQPAIIGDDAAMAPEALAVQAAAFTYLIECQ
jgi:serine protease Do